ncbi:MAG: alpha/beta hydrolase [Parvularcula sp.]
MRILAPLFCLLLTACSVELDERMFWAPRDVAFDDNREGQAGLFMGEVLDKAMSLDFYHRGEWTTRIVFDLDQDDFIPATTEKLDIPFSKGNLSAVAFRRKEPIPGSPLIIQCYGIGADIYNNGVQYALKALPFGDTVEFDLPGFGESDGSPTVSDFNAAADAIVHYAESVDPDRDIVFWGHSLGGFICANIAARSDRTAGLIIEATSYDAISAAKTWVPFLVRPFIRFRLTDALKPYNMGKLIKGVDVPILVMGGGKDDVIAEKYVREMADRLRSQGFQITYRAFPEANHATIPFADGFLKTVGDFLATLP